MASRKDLRLEIQELPERRRKYFLYKHGINTNFTKYSEWTEEDLRESLDASDITISNLKKWEETEEYQRLKYRYVAENFNKDTLEVYEAIKEQAKSGNSSAVKTMFELQEKISNQLDMFYKLDGKIEGETGYKLKV